MANQYICHAETDEDDRGLRMFRAEAEMYDNGGFAGGPRHEWMAEIISPIVEIDENGNDIGPLDHKADFKFYQHVEELLKDDAMKQWDDEEPGFTDGDLPQHRQRGY